MIAPDNNILAEEVARLPPARVLPLRAALEVEATEIAKGRKAWDGQQSLRMVDAIEYPARQMLTEAAHACAKRWFSVVGMASDPHDLLLHVGIRDLIYDKYTDIHVWRPVTEAQVTVSAKGMLHPNFQGEFTSGKQKGEWVKDFKGQTFVTQEHYVQYTRLIYRAMLIALDKAMADLAQRKLAPTAPP